MDPRKFLLSSDYPTPAIVKKWSGSYSVGQYEDKEFFIDHELPFTPLLIGQWSFSPGFDPSYDISIDTWYDPSDHYVHFSQSVASNNSQIKFAFYSAVSNNVTFYYKIFAIAPPDYSGDVPFIDDTSNFKISTDFNYPKIYEEGVFQNVDETPKIIEHNLGYKPIARVWSEETDYVMAHGRFEPWVKPAYNRQDNLGDGSFVAIDESQVTFRLINDSQRVFYHIYADKE